MKKYVCFSALLLFFLLPACSASEDKNSGSGMDMATDHSSHESEQTDRDVEDASEEYDLDAERDFSANPSARKIIHHAYLAIDVSNFLDIQQNIEQLVSDRKGYIVETTINKEETYSYGNMTIKVPAADFQSFLTDVEKIVDRVVEKNISGDDVTERYVDLQSRITSKKIVEERLLAFLKEAEKTEDLLQISNDLAHVQEDIEVLVGKMNFLQNQVDYSTVELYLTEEHIHMPTINHKDLNTIEKTKQQFLKSTQNLLLLGSTLVVFLIGNIPFIILISLVVFGIYYITKTKNKKQQASRKVEAEDLED